MKCLLHRGCALLTLLALACASASTPPAGARPQARPQGSVPIRLVAWNVANLFDSVNDPTQDTVLSPPELEKKLGEAAQVLNALNSDFVALEEVENAHCLTLLNERLQSPYPQWGLIEGNDRDRGIDVAFLSRLPVARVVSHRDQDLPDEAGVSKSYKFSRDCLEVVLDTQPPVTVLVNHFKSQLGSKKNAAAKRHVQAAGVVAIAAKIAMQRPQGVELVMGDLNDRPGSWSLEPLAEDFVDVFEGWPEELRASHRSRHGRSSLDHILISPDGRARIEQAKVYQDLAKGTSDHDPVGVMIRLDFLPPARVPLRSWTRSDPAL